MDEFKKYLQQHRNQMDEDIPDEALLQRIHAVTAKKKTARLVTMVIRITAAACLLVFITIGARWIWQQKNIPPVIARHENTTVQKESSGDTLVTSGGDTGAAITDPVDTDSGETVVQLKDATKKELFPDRLLHSFSYNYTQLVNLQLKNIRRTPVYGETAHYFNDFKHNLQQMDADEARIKSNIKKLGLNEILLEQLINVYQQKISLLKDLQHEINEQNNRVKENQLPTDSVQIHFINI